MCPLCCPCQHPTPPPASPPMSLHLSLPLSFTHCLFYPKLLTLMSTRPGMPGHERISQASARGTSGERWMALHCPLRLLVTLAGERAGVCAPHLAKWWIYRGNRDKSKPLTFFFFLFHDQNIRLKCTQLYIVSSLCLVHSYILAYSSS